MYPILYRVGPFLIYSYTAALSLGILAAIGLTAWLSSREPVENWFDAALVCLAGGLVGGRFGFVGAHWAYYQSQPGTLLRFWQGGYSYWGALLGALVGLGLWWIIWGRRKRPFSAYSDLLTPGLVLLCAFGWAACWLEGCAYGQETILGPFAADLPDEYGVFAVRYQTQALALLWTLVIFAVIWFNRRRWEGGRLLWATLALLSLGYAGVSLLRGDPAVMAGNIRLDTILNGTLVLFCAIILANWRQTPLE